MTKNTALAAAQTMRTLVDIAMPVYNEANELEANIRRLHTYLETSFPFGALITIVDNASADGTWAIAERLASELPGVRALHLDQKGRGRALRAAWTKSEADVVAYMDIDLSTGLDALLPLVAPLVSRHSDLAIGSRLARGARVIRGPKRELISRCYNALLRVVFHAGFSDAQCGFKAMRRDHVGRLLPEVSDNAWFFDTELLIIAERLGLRIHEVPVDWTDDPDSRVDIAKTALADLRGVWRLRVEDPVDPLERMAAHLVVDDLSELVRYLAACSLWPLGVVVTYLGLFAALQGAMGPYLANAIGVVLVTLLSLGSIFRLSFARSASPARCAFPLTVVRVLGTGAVTSACLLLARMMSSTLLFELGAIGVGVALSSLLRFIWLDALVYRRYLQQAEPMSAEPSISVLPDPLEPQHASRQRRAS